MIPVALPQTRNASSLVLAKDQPEYRPLPCLMLGDGTLLICWQLTWRERLALLSKGKLFHKILTFRQPLQPIQLAVEMPEEFK